MAQIMQDKYVLGQSPSQAITTVGQEIRVDLQLAASTNALSGGQVTGTVSDAGAKPVANALVKLMDTNYNPITHAVTNSSGVYTLNNIPAGSYSVFAIAQGMSLQQSLQFSVAQLQTVTQNLTLQSDPIMSLAIIPGIVTDSSTNAPIGGAVVSLYSVDANNNQTLQSVLYTNQYGQFIFRQVATGNYSITITALGYTSTTSKTSVTTAGQIVPLQVTLTADSSTGTGTVSGIITDSNKVAISSADVILYKVNTDNSLTPVAFTKTNTNGVYLFGNVPPANYKVKSSQTQMVTVNVTINYAPSFDYFFVSNYSSLSVSATTGTLAGGALISYNGQMVTFGLTINNPGVTVSVTAPTAGKYIMGVQYIKGNDAARSLLVDVNGTNTGTTYTPPINAGWDIYNYNIFSVPVTLNQGANTIKLYNTGTNYPPNMGMLYFAPVTTFSSVNGTLANGAVAAPGGTTGFVGAIGDTGGTLTINPTVPIAGQYTLGIEYLAGDAARPIMVSVNGTPTGTTYSCPKTTDWAPANASTFNVTVNLTAGANTIQFYNSPNAAGPWVGTLTMTPLFQVTAYDASLSTLSGSAVVSGGVVNGIQTGNGSLVFTANAPSAGTYNFGIGYVSSYTTAKCNIAVNGTATGTTYSFPKTVDLTGANELIQTTQLTLKSGANTIQIYTQ